MRELREAARARSVPADYLAQLLEAAAEEIHRREEPARLPEAEQAIWERVGARFDDKTASARMHARRAVASVDLMQRSVAGDAAVAEILGVDRSRISQRVADRSLYAFHGAQTRCFPRWQFLETTTLPKLRTVLEALDPHVHPLTVDHWFTTPNVDLDIDGEPATPVEWLATGGDASVAAELAADL